MAAHVLSKHLCEDLVHYISEIVHKDRMVDVLSELLTRPGIFEQDDPIAHLVQQGHMLLVRHDDYDASVVHIDDSHFVLWHEYNMGDILMIEGFIDNGFIKIERLYLSFHEHQQRQVIESMENLNVHTFDTYPFVFLLEHYANSEYTIDFSYYSGKRWYDINRVWSWFETTRYYRFNSAELEEYNNAYFDDASSV